MDTNQLPLQTHASARPTDRSEGDVNLSDRHRAYAWSHRDTTHALLEEDARYFLHQSLSSPCLNAAQSVTGSFIYDRNRRAILDFHGNSTHQVGHANPAVIDAIKRQLDELTFCPRRFTCSVAVELARRLAHLAPVGEAGTPGRVLFAPAGTVALSTALKLARYATGRYKTISMAGSFHGATIDAISVGGERLFREGLGPLLPGCLHVPGYDASDMGRRSADLIAETLEREGDIAAVIAEPMRWTTVVPPTPGYWQAVREACDRHGALLVFDEIPACLGRTGKLFCTEHFGVRPDILVIGKGLGGGVVPMAAMIAREDLNVAGQTALGHYTHEKSPIGAAAALATLDVIARDGLVARAADRGRALLVELDAMRASLPAIAAVRGLGLQLAVELGSDREPTAALAERVLYRCLSNGLSFKVAAGRIITLTPPLTVSDDELSTALKVLADAIRIESSGS